MQILVRTQPGYQFPEEPYIHNKRKVAIEPEGDVWLMDWYTDPVIQLNIPNGLTISGWNRDGTQPIDPETDEPLYPVDPYYYTIRELGNRPDGHATGQLRYTYPAGYGQVYLRRDWLYPEDNDGMAVESRHKEFAQGWGMRSEILHVDQTRPPGNRTLRLYNDPECTDFRFALGNYQLQDSDWQVDDEGNPVEVWANETNPAQSSNPEKIDWHHALWVTSNQEGYATLRADQDSVVFNFWKDAQTSPTQVTHEGEDVDHQGRGVTHNG